MSVFVQVVVDWEGTAIEVTNSTDGSNATFSDGKAHSVYEVAEMLEDAYRRAKDAVFSRGERQ